MRALRAFARILWNIARELSDEAAYRRYLERHGEPASAKAWSAFTDRKYRRKYQKPKCC